MPELVFCVQQAGPYARPRYGYVETSALQRYREGMQQWMRALPPLEQMQQHPSQAGSQLEAPAARPTTAAPPQPQPHHPWQPHAPRAQQQQQQHQHQQQGEGAIGQLNAEQRRTFAILVRNLTYQVLRAEVARQQAAIWKRVLAEVVDLAFISFCAMLCALVSDIEFPNDVRFYPPIVELALLRPLEYLQQVWEHGVTAAQDDALQAYMLVFLIVYLIYHTLFVAWRGATPGQSFVGIVFVRLTGNALVANIPLPTAFLRVLCKLLCAVVMPVMLLLAPLAGLYPFAHDTLSGCVAFTVPVQPAQVNIAFDGNNNNNNNNDNRNAR